ncbi:anti-anti-sigma factor [Nocardioides silvaticus]|uniref:Anti-sigma factor antagonist n=1 Tax=Nocardioides silvaticus TaxID=2201891 RepID=A0A316TBV2_9ACTN|nr:STAS domain-containing protein [Nocardioides silvaticus]PWN00991.1 anti-anti-sigma factor [Nocardioides silvaticus]
MQIEQSQRNGVAVLTPTGRVNMVSAPKVKAAVDEAVAAGTPRVVIDLAQVEFIDSSGLGALVGGLKSARQADGDLRIAAAGDQVVTVLSLTNLDRILRPYASVEDAIDGW